MKCPSCHFENPSDTVYCGKCAARLKPEEKASIPYTETLQRPRKELARGTVFAGRYEVIYRARYSQAQGSYPSRDNPKIEPEEAFSICRSDHHWPDCLRCLEPEKTRAS